MLTASYLQDDKTSLSKQSVREQTSSSINTTRGLPENTVYEDTGCDLAPSCLECPLALCKYDDPNGARYDRTVMRDTEIMRLFAEGLKVSAIALRVNISNRTVYRVIQREFGATGDEADGRGDEADGRTKRTTRGRALRERVPVRRLNAWRQYSMREMADARVA